MVELLLVAPLAAWGLAYIIAVEDGPFGIFSKIRNFDFCSIDSLNDLQLLQDCIEKNTPETAEHKTYTLIRNALVGYVTGIFGCIFCANPYTAAIVLGFFVLSGHLPISWALVPYWAYIFGVGIAISSVWELAQDV